MVFARACFVGLVFVSVAAAQAAENTTQDKPDLVAKAKAEEDAWHSSAEAALTKAEDYIDELTAARNNTDAIKDIAEAIVAKASAEFAANESAAEHRMSSHVEAMEQLSNRTNKTATELQEYKSLMDSLKSDTKALAHLEREEHKAVRHGLHDAEKDAKDNGKQLGEAAKIAAKEWKKAAKLTEKAQQRAHLSERVYEGDYGRSERASEKQAGLAERAGDKAENEAEALYGKVEAVVEASAHKKHRANNGQGEQGKQHAENDAQALVANSLSARWSFAAALPLCGVVCALVTFALASARRQRRARGELTKPMLAQVIVQ